MGSGCPGGEGCRDTNLALASSPLPSLLGLDSPPSQLKILDCPGTLVKASPPLVSLFSSPEIKQTRKLLSDASVITLAISAGTEGF